MYTLEIEVKELRNNKIILENHPIIEQVTSRKVE